MQQVECTLFFQKSTREPKVNYSLRTIVFALCPAIQHFDVVPPLHVINKLINKGIYHEPQANEGFRWNPFELTKEEFNQLINNIGTDLIHNNIEYIEPDSWVEDEEDWIQWLGIYKFGIDDNEYQKNYFKMKEIKVLIRSTPDPDPTGTRQNLNREYNQLMNTNFSIMNKYRQNLTSRLTRPR